MKFTWFENKYNLYLLTEIRIWIKVVFTEGLSLSMPVSFLSEQKNILWSNVLSGLQHTSYLTSCQLKIIYLYISNSLVQSQ